MNSLKTWAKLRILAAGSILAAAGVLPAQNPGTGGVKYYPGTVTPGSQANPGTVRPPAGTIPGDAPPRSMATTPPPGVVIPADRPRLTAPVIAGPDGVRSAGAQDVELIRQIPPTISPTPPVTPRPASTSPPTVADLPALPTTQAHPTTPPVPVAPQDTTPRDVNRTFAPSTTTAPGTPATSAPAAILPVPHSVSPPVVRTPEPTVPMMETPPAATYSPTLPAPSPEMTPGTLPGMTGSLPSAIPTAGQLDSKVSPHVSLEFEAPESAGVGQPVTYTLILRNTGTSSVMNVRVDEEIPAYCTYVSSEPISETANQTRLSWTVGTMEAGAEKRIRVTVKTMDEGEIRSRAAVTFAAAVETKIKVTRPKLSITMTGPDVVRVGEPMPLKITIANVGTGMAHKIPLKAQYTEGLKFRSDRGDVIDGIIETEWANLPAGQSKSFTLNLITVKPGLQQCLFTASTEGGAPESAKVSVTLVEPQLVAKQTGPAKCLVRAEPVYQIELSNPGSATTDPIQAWTMIPEGFEFISASDGGVFTPANNAVVWKLAGMAAGSSRTLSVKLRSVLPTAATIKTVVQSGTAEPADKAGIAPAAARGKVLEVRCETKVQAEGVAALRFDVAGVEGLVEVGKEAVYEIRIINQGTGPCTNVALEAELAEGTTAVSATGATVGKPHGQRIVFEPIAQLGVRGEAVYKVRVRGNSPGDMRFRVKMMCDQVRAQVVKEEITRFFNAQ